MSLRTGIKNVLDNFTNPLGIEIVRHFGKELGLKQVYTVFKEQKIDLLLDIGANTGQYAMSMFKTGYKGRIVSFEPLPDAYLELKKNKSKYPGWELFERSAIGDTTGTTMINVSANSHSSSILPINETHLAAAPSAKYIGQVETPIFTLDSIFNKISPANDKICLKIDTQGFEDKVLAGATASLQKISLIQLELSLLPLYNGSKTIEWMIPYLKDRGFAPLFFLPGYIERETEKIQQLEALFIKI